MSTVHLATARRPFTRSLRSACRRALLTLLLGASVAAPALAHDDQRHDDRGEPYAIALWGDLAYSDEQATTGVVNLIADMNAHRLAFSVHDGDLKAGSGNAAARTGFCDDALYTRALSWFQALEAPAMFTPGDNDWTDCDRPANGGFNSRERLSRERQVFFSTPWSMGQRKLRQDVQTDAQCLTVNGTEACTENRRWH